MSITNDLSRESGKYVIFHIIQISRYILIAIFSFHSTVGFTLTTMIFRFEFDNNLKEL